MAKILKAMSNKVKQKLRIPLSFYLISGEI